MLCLSDPLLGACRKNPAPPQNAIKHKELDMTRRLFAPAPHVERTAPYLAWPRKVQLQGTQAHVTPGVQAKGETRSQPCKLNLNRGSTQAQRLHT